MTIDIYTDGGARGNPGPAGIGAVIFCNPPVGKDACMYSFAHTIGESTNNVAEYTALREALVFVKEYISLELTPDTKITCNVDSLLVVEQLNGTYKVKKAHLRTFLVEIRSLEQSIGGLVYYQHISRMKNSDADSLVNLALDSV